MPHTLPRVQAGEAQRDAAEAAIEVGAAAATPDNAGLIDSAKDAVGQLQDQAAGIYEKAKAKAAKGEL